ncbi:MAG: hypothetical protein JNM18_27130 [Planctomycetaceae bacterium]|nr:hypothetical protein [Planctomycetaceae bacterium]
MNLFFAYLRAPFRFVYWHPWWSVFLAAVGFLISTVGAYKFVEYRSYCDLAAAIAETDAASPRWRIEELEADRAEIPDAENSALVIAKVAELRKRAEQQIPPQFDLDDFRGTEDYSPQHRLVDARLEKMRGALRGIQPALDEAAKLTNMPRGRWPIKHEPDGISTMVPHIGTVRGVARLLQAQAVAASHEANSPLATDCLIGMLYTGRSMADEPIVVSALVQTTIRSMAASALESSFGVSALSTNDLGRLERVVAYELESLDGASMFHAERAFVHSFFTHLEQLDSVSYLATIGSVRNARSAVGMVTDPLYRPMIPADHAFALRMLNRGCVIAAQPTETQHQGFDEWIREWAKSVLRGPLVYRNIVAGDLLPFSAKYSEYHARALAWLRVLQTTLAIEQFRLEYGRWPHEVVELVPKFAKETPRDPFDGQPLRMITDDKGVTIYSIGVNRQDDGGAKYSERDEGDVALRLFNPEQRGLPALPEKPAEGDASTENNNP